MSIINKLVLLELSRKLVLYKPSVRRPIEPQGGRKLWLTPEANLWCSPPASHPDIRISDESLSALGDQFNAFVSGDFMGIGQDIKRLCPDTTDIWEIKSHMKKPQLRVLGWFALPTLFVATHCAVRDDLEDGKGPKWDAIIAKTADNRSELVGSVAHWNSDPRVYVRNPK
jgi:hypothetical protein